MKGPSDGGSRRRIIFWIGKGSYEKSGKPEKTTPREAFGCNSRQKWKIAPSDGEGSKRTQQIGLAWEQIRGRKRGSNRTKNLALRNAGNCMLNGKSRGKALEREARFAEDKIAQAAKTQASATDWSGVLRTWHLQISRR